MAHIQVPNDAPGIVGLMLANPKTAIHLNALADSILCDETKNLTKAERETIASYVSYLNNCVFCSESHAEVANAHFSKPNVAQQCWDQSTWHSLPLKMQAILKVAGKVQKDPRLVNPSDITQMHELGLTDQDIHDVVLIAAAFCMYNRYVDGLGTWAPPRGDTSYKEMGKKLKEVGYQKILQE
jgi:uncharacterized peroxidase-related enzyme